MPDNMFTAPDNLRKVVLCKDCKYYDKPVCTLLSEAPSQYGTGCVIEMDSDDFCSYGLPTTQEASNA